MKSKDFIKIESFLTSKKLEEKFFFDFDKKHEFSNLFWREAKHYKKRKIRYFSRNFFKNKKKNKDFTKMRGKILSSISFLLNKKKKIFFVNKKFVNKKYFSGYSILSEDNRKVLKNKTKFNIGSMRSVVFRDKVKRSRFLIFEKKKKINIFFNNFISIKKKIKKEGSKCQINNICFFSGRAHSVYRKYGLSRIFIRSFGYRGLIPGIRKSVW